MFEKEAEEYIKEHTFFDEEYGVQSLDVVSKTIFKDGAEFGYNKANEWHYPSKGELPKEDTAERETLQNILKRIEELEAENERIKTKYYKLQETLKKVRLALIKERTANIMNYGKGGVEMFDSMFEILKGVSN